MKDSVFREYDIRGIVGEELNLDQVYKLGCAIAYYFAQHNPELKTVVVGRDARSHSPLIKKELFRALTDAGLTVLNVGICSSPVIYFGLHTQKIDAGIMITASHNPAAYNGLKICLGTTSLSGEAIREIRTLYKQNKKLEKLERPGDVKNINLVDLYVDWITNHFVHLKNMDVPLIVDCGNGTSGPELLKVIDKLCWTGVDVLYADADGTFPNHEADPSVEKNMQDVKEALIKGKYLFGIGLDGDGDRMGAMTKGGTLIPADRLLALFAQPLFADAQKNYSNTGVVFDIRSSQGLVDLLTEWGTNSYWSPAGHSNIKKSMKEKNALLGGEMSCHFMFADKYFGYDDGIYAALRLIEIIVASGKSLDELISIFPNKYSSPEIRIRCGQLDTRLVVKDVHESFARSKKGKLTTIDGVRVECDYGWGLVRESNTQPVLSMRFESDSPQGLQLIKKDFFIILRRYFDDVLLKQELQL